MLNEVNGLPTHILLVHAVIVLVPLAALLTVLERKVDSWFREGSLTPEQQTLDGDDAVAATLCARRNADTAGDNDDVAAAATAAADAGDDDRHAVRRHRRDGSRQVPIGRHHLAVAVVQPVAAAPGRVDADPAPQPRAQQIGRAHV